MPMTCHAINLPQPNFQLDMEAVMGQTLLQNASKQNKSAHVLLLLQHGWFSFINYDYAVQVQNSTKLKMMLLIVIYS